MLDLSLSRLAERIGLWLATQRNDGLPSAIVQSEAIAAAFAGEDCAVLAKAIAELETDGYTTIIRANRADRSSSSRPPGRAQALPGAGGVLTVGHFRLSQGYERAENMIELNSLCSGSKLVGAASPRRMSELRHLYNVYSWRVTVIGAPSWIG